MRSESSAVLEFGVPELGETASVMEDKLRFHPDSWDLSVDLEAGSAGIGVIDARGHDAYAAGHIPGAISFPHREMSVETTANLDRSMVYVVYCDGTSRSSVTAAPEPCSIATSRACRSVGVMTSPRQAAETGLPLTGRPENFFAMAGNRSIWPGEQTSEPVRPDQVSIVPSVTATA